MDLNIFSLATQLAVLIVVLAALHQPLGKYLAAHVHQPQAPGRGTRTLQALRH